jgi:hypothetical protein
MGFDITFGRGEPLPPGRYRSVLESVDLVDTRYDEKLKFVFKVPDHGAEVVGWAKPSNHPRSNAYLYSTALNPAIKTERRFRPEDVVGRECLLDLDIYDGVDGKKNRIDGILPVEE